jgi:predicted RNase H-related nuclease YkuK (DUF458 family)
MGKENKDFISPTKGPLSKEEVIDDIAKFIESGPNEKYHIVLGTDSQAHNNDGVDNICFVTALIVHREGKGARYFWRKEVIREKPILRKKIWTETTMSLLAAQELVPELNEAITAVKFDFEIHIDVGPLGETRDMIKEVVGMINGNGFVAKTKPESWGASSVADKHT